jgi:pilus assembly protein CpaF
VRPNDAGRLVTEAVDLLVQLGIRSEVRRVTLVANVAKRVRPEEVGFDPIFRFGEQSTATHPQWTRVGSLGARITAETSL